MSDGTETVTVTACLFVFLQCRLHLFNYLQIGILISENKRVAFEICHSMIFITST